MTRVAVRCSLSRRTRTVALLTAALALAAGAVAAIAAPARAATPGLTIRTSGSTVTLTLSGDQPAGPVLFQRTRHGTFHLVTPPSLRVRGHPSSVGDQAQTLGGHE